MTEAVIKLTELFQINRKLRYTFVAALHFHKLVDWTYLKLNFRFEIKCHS